MSKLKVAIISYGHFSSLFSLVPHLAKLTELDIFLSVHGLTFSESILDLKLDNIPFGCTDDTTTRKHLGPRISDYLGKDCRIHLLKYPSLKTLNLRNLLISVKMARRINREKYDIVNFNGIKILDLYIRLFLKTGRSFWTIHDPFHHSGETKKTVEYHYWLRSMLKANFILYNNFHFEKFKMKYRIPESKCHVAGYGSLEIFRIFDRKIENTPQEHVLFFGRISLYKGIDILMKAAEIVVENMPDVKFLIAGKGDIIRGDKPSRNQEYLTILNRYIENEELVNLIRESRFVVCPYKDATQSGVIMTAFALNKPVIASNVGGIPEVVKHDHNGLLVAPNNPDELANAIVFLLRDRECLTRFEHNLEIDRKKGALSWQKVAEATVSAYKTAR